ncbi:AAA family ATPase [Shewanella sp. GXUN23E]|uniref:AAA family ATPase n=1 Tax=Shewanella sp. GXUN23E TaxID=3422498 RepID=UPI003D7EDE75
MFALLPSQQALLQRLHLNASYTRQLQVVTGGKGMGKTTLVTALADELEGYNSALVICPAHADCAEIRRKILVQLTSSAIFDDELPLADSLFRLRDELTQPVHIIVDDAHLLPMTLWAECLVLSQLECGGKPVSLTFTATTAFMAELTAQMTDVQQQLMLTVPLSYLGLAEREQLFNMLLARTGETPFLASNAVDAQLQQQSGTPAEVVALLERVLFPQEERPKRRIGWWLALAGMSSLVVAVLLWAFVSVPEPEPPDFSIRLSEQQFERLSQRGAMLLDSRSPADGVVPVVNIYQANSSSATDISILLESGSLAESASAADLASMSIPDLAADSETAPGQLRDDDDIDRLQMDDLTTALTILPAATLADTKELVLPQELITATGQNNVSPSLAAETVADMPHQIDTPLSQAGMDDPRIELAAADTDALDSAMPAVGYGIQLASVKHADSLKQILTSLRAEADIVVLQSGQWWLVLQGQYASKSEAEIAAFRLKDEYRLGQPWVRNWSSMQRLALYKP